jgi:hypothetical protein
MVTIRLGSNAKESKEINECLAAVCDLHKSSLAASGVEKMLA